MFLNNLIESEDLLSLSLVDLSQLDQINREIVEHILKTQQFSAHDIGKSLSIKHALRYIELCEGKQYQEVKDGIKKHVTKLINLEDI